MDGKLKLAVIVSVLALLLFTGNDKKVNSLSGISKRRARRLFYISGGKVIPRSQVDSAKRMTRQGYGKVYAVWAFNADEAREYIRQGKAETVSGLGETPQWKYDEYSNFSRLYARDNTIPELEKELYKLEKEQVKNSESRFKSLEKAGSMRHAQAGNVVRGNYERRQAIKDAIEIHKYYPEKAKGGQKQKLIPESRGQMTLFGVDTFKKGDRVELKTRYGDVPVGKEGTLTKVWTDPNTGTQWGRVFYGKNRSGQRLQQSYPLSVFRNLSRSKSLPEQTSFTERSQMTLFGLGKLGKGQCTTIIAGRGGSPEGTLMTGCNMPGGFRIVGKKGMMGLSAIPTGNEIYMQSSPISKELQHRFEQTTFSPYDLNKEFNSSVQNMEDEALEKLKANRVTDVPEDVQTALAYYRKALYQYYTTKANQVPGPMVTGPSNYNYNKLNKSNAREDKAIESLDTAKEYIRKAVNRAIKVKSGGRRAVSQEIFDQWMIEATHTPRRKFGEKFYEYQYAHAHPNMKEMYDRGVYVDTERNQGRKIHERLIEIAIAEGYPIYEGAEKDYPVLFGKEKPKKENYIQKADRALIESERAEKAKEDFRLKQEENERIVEEWKKEGRERREAEKKRKADEAEADWQETIREQEAKKPKAKLIPEEKGQMTLFGRLPMPKVRIYSHG
jgi:hypothetical protein